MQLNKLNQPRPRSDAVHNPSNTPFLSTFIYNVFKLIKYTLIIQLKLVTPKPQRSPLSIRNYVLKRNA